MLTLISLCLKSLQLKTTVYAINRETADEENKVLKSLDKWLKKKQLLREVGKMSILVVLGIFHKDSVDEVPEFAIVFQFAYWFEY